ncbi:MAG: right-handed parallel beta-helix repeat-containing protein [Planctomycetota bacterium]
MNRCVLGRRLRHTRRPGPLSLEICERRLVLSGTGLLPVYDTGTPDVVDIWVDPASGSDLRSGASRDVAVQTLAEAWRRVPVRTTLSQGVRINLVAGTYPQWAVPHFWESRHGTFTAPVIIRAADGPGTARLPSLNIFDCRHLQLVGLEVTAGGGDVVQIQASSHVLLRDTTIRGTGEIATYAVPQEALKVNQSQHVYIEHCDISGAWDNAVDFVAVQYGHVVGSRIHRSGDWAMYAKGGSASLTITGNEFFDAGTGGFTAGQGTGFEFMVAPWLHYEAYDIAFTNNVIRDVQGAGMGVNGGFNILLAHNTLVNVGRRSHVIEVVHGLRSCDGDTVTCAANLALGGWGTATAGREESIPNRNVVIVNNVVFNPEGAGSQWEQFAVAAPRTPAAGSNIPSPARGDDGLMIRGNVIWNGPAGHPLGIGNAALAADVLAHNAINTVRPAFADLARGDYTLAASFTPPATVAIPAFTWAAAPGRPAVPAGRSDLSVRFDHTGAARVGPQAPGAFTAAGSVAPGDPPPVDPPPADSVPPRILAVVAPRAGLYRPGAVLVFTMRFSEAVTVAGRPRLAFLVGRVVQRAEYVSGSGTDRLLFRWTVPVGLSAPTGIRLARQLALPAGAAISDLAGNLAMPTFTPPATGGIRILPRRR